MLVDWNSLFALDLELGEAHMFSFETARVESSAGLGVSVSGGK